jgi:urea transport system permease protein
VITVLVVFVSYMACRFIVKSKAGRVLTAIRDAESKVMFCGYNPRDYKLFAWTFAAVLSGLAGALYAPQVGIINPSEMEPSNSIEMAIWVAVGGRGTLGGALLGAGLVNGLKSWLTVSYPDLWLYVLALLFVLVTLLLPNGVAGVLLKRRAPAKGK